MRKKFFNMRTSLDLCFCLLTLCGITSVLYGVKVVVDEGSDAVLPCLISTKEDITEKLFFWRKDGPKEVLIYKYSSGIHSKNAFTDQHYQFKGRVSHFQNQLMNGNASIKINNTKVTDSGNYSCIFPRHQPRQTSIIELVVAASPKPCITILDETHDWSLLQCEVQGASPKPKVEWKNSSGNILPAEEPQVSERRSSYSITLKTTVTKTGRYRCVVTQEEINHQTYSETFVFINENPSIRLAIELFFGGIITGASLLGVVQAGLVATKCITVTCNQGCPPDDPESNSPLNSGGRHLRITRPPDYDKILVLCDPREKFGPPIEHRV